MVSNRAVPPSPGPTRCHEREDPPDLCFCRGGGSGLELEVEAACIGEGFTGFAGSIEFWRRVCFEDRRTGTGNNSGMCFKCQDAIAEEQDFFVERGNFVLDPRVDIGLNPDSPSLRLLLLLLRDLDLFNVRVEKLFAGCDGCGTGWLCHIGWSWG